MSDLCIHWNYRTRRSSRNVSGKPRREGVESVIIFVQKSAARSGSTVVEIQRIAQRIVPARWSERSVLSSAFLESPHQFRHQTATIASRTHVSGTGDDGGGIADGFVGGDGGGGGGFRSRKRPHNGISHVMWRFVRERERVRFESVKIVKWKFGRFLICVTFFDCLYL